MKKIAFIFFVVITSVIACKKDNIDTQKSEETLDVQKIALTTLAAVFRTDNSIKTGGSSSVDLAKYTNIEYGVCFGELENPTINDKTSISNALSGGDFENIIDKSKFDAEKSLYVRAYVKNKSNNSVKYGNQVKADNTSSLEIIAIKDIGVFGFTVDFRVGAEYGNIYEMGFCFSTSPNPTIGNSFLKNPTKEAGTYSLTLLTDNRPYSTKISIGKVYYVRAYVTDYNGNHYSEPMTFKSVGFRNERGGLVFYDKGKESDGWRYLEAATAPLATNTFSIFRWDCNSSIGENIYTSTEVGSGMSNTEMISGKCNSSNNAATQTLNWLHNSKNDWFIPAYDEFKLLNDAFVNELLDELSSFQFWTSSQYNSTIAYSFYLNKNAGVYKVDEYKSDKSQTFKVWPIRKY